MSRVYDTKIRRQENDGTQIKKEKKRNAEKLVAVQSANNLLWNSLRKFQLLFNA